MERDCYCCRPGSSIPATVPFVFESHPIPLASRPSETVSFNPVTELGALKINTSQCGPGPFGQVGSKTGHALPQLGPTVPSRHENQSMDVDLALSELDDLQMSTGYTNDSAAFQSKDFYGSPGSEKGDSHPGRSRRYRSFSESTSAFMQGLSDVYRSIF